MNTFRRIAIAGFAFCFIGGTSALHAQYGPPQGPPPQGYGQGPGGPGGPGGYGQGGWDAPPQAYSDIQRRGFHDGVEGARKDFENHRQPNVNNRDEYRHPDNVPGRLRRDYRAAFRSGYQAGVQHIMRGGPGPR
ncbi:hypothetical protein [Acidipila sp. EB88]|uniref:hypothetical protein n=1 Tax=Acidipila sp. EB88 TaxID=2305226 RepID=UPI0018F5CABD|nr:hypothetical protein [Acidipila sp. EB88]